MRPRSHKVRRRAPGWPQSAAFRNIASTAIKAFHARRYLLPKCGATAKSTGLPCGNLAMTNGRCYAHGGSTPSGDQWHQLKKPTGTSEKSVRRLNAKLAKLDAELRKRGRRVLALSPGEVAEYEKWKASHRPGSSAARAERRRILKQNREARALHGERPPQPANPELARIQARIDELKAELAGLEEINGRPDHQHLGVFG